MKYLDEKGKEIIDEEEADIDKDGENNNEKLILEELLM